MLFLEQSSVGRVKIKKTIKKQKNNEMSSNYNIIHNLLLCRIAAEYHNNRRDNNADLTCEYSHYL